ncbi:hypothetical protein BYT27DRAFT_6493138 [Phlegmacium glaucopus]|nr:hypothetical protein BYT27DRAFT_6493138 [Phlegmacium glaucopus]
MHHLHPRQQLPLHLHLLIQARLRAESTGLSRRCSRPLIFGTTPDITRYATMSHAGTQDRIVSGKEPPRFQNPYPYPAHAKPTPHQIFHLGPGATQGEIKERYYDLVRAHHPDSSYARLSTNNSAEAHSRFRSIKAAYDFLRGRTLSPDPNANPTPSPQNFDPYMHELARRRRAYNASRDSFGRTAWAEGFGAPQQERGEWNENGKKERLILLFGVAALVGGLFPCLPMTFISIIFPTSVLPSSMFPFSLFASSSLAPLSSRSSNTPFDSPPSVPSSSFIYFLSTSIINQCKIHKEKIPGRRPCHPTKQAV